MLIVDWRHTPGRTDCDAGSSYESAIYNPISMEFKLLARDSTTRARLGKIVTDHGEILTPVFMPVGTAGTVKGHHLRTIWKSWAPR